ncbi:MAG TPA: hypothetical protein VJU82_00960, partial [Acidobacteriaceae bacterium]|nr:hypothetical protein [Acidobacteriaceae bacterium]
VYRVAAVRDPVVAVTAVQEKLLGSYAAPPPAPEYAPTPDLAAPQAGSDRDLETRIDTLPPASVSASTEGLAQVFQAVGVDAVLTVASAQTPAEPGGLWVPIHSAVVLHSAGPADPQTLASALQQTLRGSLTAASIGISSQPTDIAGATIYSLTGPRPLFFAVSSTPAQGNLILLADNQPLLLELLRNRAVNSTDTTAASATLIAVFNHASQRAPYLRLTSLIDGTNNQPREPRTVTARGANGESGVASAPAFFARNLGSLSDTFASLQSERIVERVADSKLRQTVTYTWVVP